MSTLSEDNTPTELMPPCHRFSSGGNQQWPNLETATEPNQETAAWQMWQPQHRKPHTGLHVRLARGVLTYQPKHGKQRVLPIAARKAVTALAYGLPLLPLAVVARPLHAQVPDLQKDAGDVLGLGALLCLLACMSITPLLRLTGMKQASQWRKWYGLCVFILGGAGLVIAITGGPMSVMDQWAVMRPAGHVQEWTGTVAVALLIPLAVTSARYAQKALGGYWKIWQRRLMWTVWAVLAIHLITLKAWTAEIAYLMVSGPLIVARIPAVRNDITRWRRDQYNDPHVWILTGMALALSIFGIFTLLIMEVLASARAIKLA